MDTNNSEYPTYLDDVPKLDPAYYEQSGGFDDSIYSSEPEPTHPTYPTKPRFISALDGYDQLSRASGELAAEYGIDWQKLLPQIHRNQIIYKRGIELNKSYRGKVMAWVRFKTAKSGQEYVTITFKTFKHGEVKAYFNGWEWLENNGYVGKKEDFTRPSTATTAVKPQKNFEKPKLTPLKICRSCGQSFTPNYSSFTECPDCYSYDFKLKRYQETRALFNALPLVEETSSLVPQWVSAVLSLSLILVKSYLGKKGFFIADLQATGLDIRRGQDKNGGFIIFALRNSDGKITGYQKIYDKKFTDYNGEQRDKDFCFYPLKDSKTGEIKTLKKGSYAVLGSLDNADKGLMFVEGLATGLSVFLATGLTTIICLDAGNLEPVLSHFSDYRKKYIAADFDFTPNNSGNVGIYCALKAAKKHKARVFVPILKDSVGNFIKCDFNDLHQAKGLDAVSYQLKRVKNYSEVKSKLKTFFKYCPKQAKLGKKKPRVRSLGFFPLVIANQLLIVCR